MGLVKVYGKQGVSVMTKPKYQEIADVLISELDQGRLNQGDRFTVRQNLKAALMSAQRPRSKF